VSFLCGDSQLSGVQNVPTFTLPNFNLRCHVWNDPARPPGPASLSNVPCQLYATRVIGTEFTAEDPLHWYVLQQVRLPAGTDVRWSPGSTFFLSRLELPAGSGMLWNVHQVVDFHKGFPNEYRCAFVLAHHVPLPMP
jgi:hypothetical protein